MDGFSEQSNFMPAQTSTLSDFMVNEHDHPLVTFAVFGYNQEEFIRDAIEGAFAQTYSPLEIILSDDCSTDKTFLIMTEMAEAYTGPHRIILNRNAKNLNVAGHVNHVVSISHGEIFITAGGDDISLPNRAALTAELFVRRPEVTSCISFVREFGTSERTTLFFPPDVRLTTAEACLRHEPSIGAACAYRRSIFDLFPPLPEQPPMEDTTLQFRSLLVGVYALIPEITVRYRKGHSYFADPERTISYFRLMFDQFERDLEYYCELKGKSPLFYKGVLSLRRSLVLNFYAGSKVSKILGRLIFKLARLPRLSRGQRELAELAYEKFCGPGSDVKNPLF